MTFLPGIVGCFSGGGLGFRVYDLGSRCFFFFGGGVIILAWRGMSHKLDRDVGENCQNRSKM